MLFREEDRTHTIDLSGETNMASLKAEDFARLVTLSIPTTVTALAFSPDGKMLAVASADKVHLYLVPHIYEKGGSVSADSTTG